MENNLINNNKYNYIQPNNKIDIITPLSKNNNIEKNFDENKNEKHNDKELNNIKLDIKDVIENKNSINFQIDLDTKIVYSQIIDNKTKEVIRKIPSELFLKLAKEYIQKQENKEPYLLNKRI